jgi:peptidoglycan/xylan/chitin deacetylase (PgdA/CDA1 family)/2-polyprenyl-3-methyl-5-hydroxy-6-metoxy-1,4-benzoquinol methylase
LDERAYWNRVFRTPDPWNYASEYERVKYCHTVELLPNAPIAVAIELGCAEGMFSAMLAPHVGQLLAVDISDTALARAKARCAKFTNIRFAQHDIGEGMIGRGYDLVVCSEILYYLQDRPAIERFARRVLESLAPGGHLIMAHPNMVTDDRSETGFDFNEIGAKSLGEIFASCTGFEFLRELRTELYRVQLFRRNDAAIDTSQSEDRPTPQPREIVLRKNADLEHPSIKRGGCVVTTAEALNCWVTTDIPILMYHRIANAGPTGLTPYRVSTEEFERQLTWLQQQGFHSIGFDAYCSLRFARRLGTIPGKPIVLTFDDAYTDFYDSAWPLLRRYGFGATVFVPTDYVGGRADWDAAFGEPAQIMSWGQIRELSHAGIQFGSHSCGHKLLTKLSAPAAFMDALKSRKTLEAKLGVKCSGYCYPYTAVDRIRKLMIACSGYEYAVGGSKRRASDSQDRFYIPRIEVVGTDSLDAFIEKLPAAARADPATISRYLELKAKRDRRTYVSW